MVSALGKPSLPALLVPRSWTCGEWYIPTPEAGEELTEGPPAKDAEGRGRLQGVAATEPQSSWSSWELQARPPNS